MEDYAIRLENAKEVLQNAEAILIGAGAGLSTAAGLEYSGEAFQRNYPEFIQKYHFTDLYTASFYNFPTQEEKWAFWARLIQQNRFNEKPLELYQKLYYLVKTKEYFVITTNVDGQFEKAGFPSEKLFLVQGDYSLLQCEEGCHNKTYYNENLVKRWLKETKDGRIPTELVPKCPVCGKNMDMNLRKDANFVQDEHWYKQTEKYEAFLQKYQGKNLVLLEIGVGFNTPSIIRFPFENMVYHNGKTILIRINKDYPFVSEEIRNKAISFQEDVSSMIEDLSL